MWDYLIVTASNAQQAAAYELQLQARRELGMLPQVRETLVVPDLNGKRIGSGGSTLYCLKHVMSRHSGEDGDTAATLRRLRILIVHAGGDSRRLPAYGPCGKIFVPIPGPTDAKLPPALFDRLVPAFLALPEGPADGGQIVVAAGDALILFDSTNVDFTRPGITALGCFASPEEAARHGVFCLKRPQAGKADETVYPAFEGPVASLDHTAAGLVAQAVSPECVISERLPLPYGRGSDRCAKFLQKPTIAEQAAQGALVNGQTALDIGVMSMDADSAATLLAAFGSSYATETVDLYREICCALGTEATLDHYIHAVQSSGSAWPVNALADLHSALRSIPFHVSLLPDCRFLHFGSTRQLIESGLALADQGADLPILNSRVDAPIDGSYSWIEACRIAAPVHLAGSNVLVGVDIDQPLELPQEACLDVLCGSDGLWFVRCYGIRDGFKESISKGAIFCGRPMLEWLAAAGVRPEEIWPDAEDRTLWTARVFPAEPTASGYRNWLWMYAPESASAAQREAYRSMRRYSVSEIAWLADQAAFHDRRLAIWAS